MLGKKETIEEMKTLVAESQKFAKMSLHNGSQWHLDKLIEYAEGLFDRAPFKIGDRVKLTSTPVINEHHKWGWLNCRHWMLKDAEGTVTDVDFAKGHFSAYVQFDNESWLNYNDTVETPTVPKRHYCMPENMVELVGNKE